MVFDRVVNDPCKLPAILRIEEIELLCDVLRMAVTAGEYDRLAELVAALDLQPVSTLK